MKIISAEFVKSALAPSGYPREGWPEVAFAGRSNVGKSSLINALVGKKNLARTSASPGRTRQLNFFRVNDCYSLVDLPGYGYAQVSKKERESWRQMVEIYFRTRQELKLLVLVLDLRRLPGEEEKELVGFLSAEGIPFLLVATKADKLAKSHRIKAREKIATTMGVPLEKIILFSARTGEGREELWRKLQEFLS